MIPEKQTANNCRCGAPAELMIDDTEKSNIITCSKYCGELVCSAVLNDVDLVQSWNKEQSKSTERNSYGNLF